MIDLKRFSKEILKRKIDILDNIKYNKIHVFTKIIIATKTN